MMIDEQLQSDVLDRLQHDDVLPDTVGKLSLVRFEKVPAKVEDLDQLIRWQVRKAAPFKIEDAQVSWVPGIVPPEGGGEFIVTVARRDIIESYERACEAAGAYPGIVDLATVNLINAVLASEGRTAPPSDWFVLPKTSRCNWREVPPYGVDTPRSSYA